MKKLSADAGAALSREGRRRLVAVYMRVSSEEQRDKQTIETQREELEKFCRDRGYTIHNWYPDDGVSGDVPFEKRPAGGQLMADARAGKFGAVVVYKIDRLSRRTTDALRVVELLHEEMGLEFRCSAQSFEVTEATGKLALTMMAAFAEFDKANILDRTRAGHMRRAKAGRWPCGRPAYGYRVVELGAEEGRLEIHPEHGPVVERIFRLYLENVGMARIAGLLSAEGVPSPKAGQHKQAGQRSSYRWNVSTISFILKNRVYVGEGMFYRTTAVRKEGRLVGMKDTPQESHVRIDCPAILSEAVYRAAQEQTRRNQELAPRNRKRPYLLSGRLVCGCCHYRYVGYAKSSRVTEATWRYYGCGTAWNKNAGVRCLNRNVRAEPLEAQVWDYVRPIVADPARYLAEVRAQLEAERETGPSESEVEGQLVEARAALYEKGQEEKRLRVAYRKGKLGQTEDENEAAFDADLADLQAEVALLKEQEERLAVLLRPLSAVDTAIGEAAALLEEMQAELELADRDETVRMEFVRRVVDQVELIALPDGAPRIRITVLPSLLANRPAGEAPRVANWFQQMTVNWNQLARTEELLLVA